MLRLCLLLLTSSYLVLCQVSHGSNSNYPPLCLIDDESPAECTQICSETVTLTNGSDVILTLHFAHNESYYTEDYIEYISRRACALDGQHINDCLCDTTCDYSYTISHANTSQEITFCSPVSSGEEEEEEEEEEEGGSESEGQNPVIELINLLELSEQLLQHVIAGGPSARDTNETAEIMLLVNSLMEEANMQINSGELAQGGGGEFSQINVALESVQNLITQFENRPTTVKRKKNKKKKKRKSALSTAQFQQLTEMEINDIMLSLETMLDQSTGGPSFSTTTLDPAMPFFGWRRKRQVTNDPQAAPPTTNSPNAQAGSSQTNNATQVNVQAITAIMPEIQLLLGALIDAVQDAENQVPSQNTGWFGFANRFGSNGASQMLQVLQQVLDHILYAMSSTMAPNGRMYLSAHHYIGRSMYQLLWRLRLNSLELSQPTQDKMSALFSAMEELVTHLRNEALRLGVDFGEEEEEEEEEGGSCLDGESDHTGPMALAESLGPEECAASEGQAVTVATITKTQTKKKTTKKKKKKSKITKLGRRKRQVLIDVTATIAPPTDAGTTIDTSSAAGSGMPGSGSWLELLGMGSIGNSPSQNQIVALQNMPPPLRAKLIKAIIRMMKRARKKGRRTKRKGYGKKGKRNGGKRRKGYGKKRKGYGKKQQRFGKKLKQLLQKEAKVKRRKKIKSVIDIPSIPAI